MDTNKLLDEIKEYFDVVMERPQDDIKLLAENISAERKTLKDHHKRLGKIEKRLDSVEGGFPGVHLRLSYFFVGALSAGC